MNGRLREFLLSEGLIPFVTGQAASPSDKAGLRD